MMKKYLMLMPLFILFSMASCIKSDSDVVGPSCKPNLLPEQIRSVSVIDPKNTATNSPTIALFKFSQLLQSYQGTQCENRIPNCTVNLMVKNTTSKKIQFDYIGDFSFLKIGDTVLIEYAKDDPTVAKVKDRYYMKKYNYLKTK
jgi:hypothetical protein